MFYVAIKNTKQSKWEYAHKNMRNLPYFGTFDDAIGFLKVDDAVNWFGRQRHHLMQNLVPTDYDMESVRVMKVSLSNKLDLRW